MSIDYYNQKAKHMYELFLKGLPCKKVYAAVKKNDKFVVLKNAEGRKFKYQLSGGGVDDGEDAETAIKREIIEELNMNVRVVKSLGSEKRVRTWKYEDKEFNVNYEVEIFLTEFISYGKNKNFGLEGEFGADKVTGIAIISKEEMLANVYEFTNGIMF